MNREKQIEEVRKDIFAAFGGYAKWEEDWQSLAEAVYNAGYRKQSEGEWIFKGLDEFRKYKVTCPFCKAEYIGNYDAYDEPEDFNFCPNCGAKMKGGGK